MPFYNPIRLGASGGAAEDFTVDRSLRFNDNDSTYLTRTPSSTGDRRTFTISFWIKIGNLDAEKEDIIRAAKEANAHEFIEEQINGYETVIGDYGNKLSGGQKQRLTIQGS